MEHTVLSSGVSSLCSRGQVPRGTVPIQAVRGYVNIAQINTHLMYPRVSFSLASPTGVLLTHDGLRVRQCLFIYFFVSFLTILFCSDAWQVAALSVPFCLLLLFGAPLMAQRK